MIEVHTTIADRASAARLARLSLEARLAACATMSEGLISLFHWQGRIDDEVEVGLTLKTTARHRAALVALIRDAHPYDLPVITWTEHAATPEAEAWAEAETG